MQVLSEAVRAPGRDRAAAATRGLTGSSVIWAVSLAALVFTAVACTTSRLLMLDTFASLAAGREIAQHGVPHTEVLTWAAHGRPWIDQQWLGQWLYYEAYRLGGYPAVGALSALSIALAFGVLAAYMLHRGTSTVRTLIWVAVAYAVCELNTVMRTQSFAYPLFVLMMVILLEDDRRHRFSRGLLALPLLFLLWANLHGSVLLAAPIVVIYCLWAAAHNLRPVRRRTLAAYLGLAACMPLALLTTPYGLTIADYYRSVLDNPVLTARVAEWHPATFGGPSTQFVIVLLASIGLLGFAYGRGSRPPLFMVGLTFALAVAGIHAVRYQVWFGFAATLLVAEVMSGTSASSESPLIRRVSARVVPAAAVIGVVGSSLLLATTATARFEALSPRPAMDATAAWAAAHPQAKIMAGDTSASALLWTHPELTGRVGFDSRYEIYSQRQLLAYTDWVAGNGSRSQWSRVVDGYDEVLLSTAYRQNVIDRMRTLPGWHRIYGDADGVVFVRAAAR
jgi:hypothetical protein